MKSNEEIEVDSVGPLTPHNEALYETGKELLKNSISTGRDFCKFMITLSTGAIPTYLGLLEFVLPEEFSLSITNKVLSIIPPFIFLASSVIFILGYLPTVVNFSLDEREDIEKAYKKIFSRRQKYIIVGSLVFLIATIWAIFTVVLHSLGLT